MARQESHLDRHLVKCVVVGDTGVGKTRLICARACRTKYTLSQLMQTHVPTVWAIDHYRKDKNVYEQSWCMVDGVYVSLQLWDTFGYHDKDRKFAYSKADVVLVCFSTVRLRSLRNVLHHWLPEIRHHTGGTPIILCGNQIDLRYLYKDPEFLNLNKGPFFREITSDDVISPEEGRRLAGEIGALYYYETSVLIPYGIDDVFENVIRVGLAYKRDKHFWSILNNSLKRVNRPRAQEPFMPPRPKPPQPVIPESSWQADLRKLFADGASCDVAFRPARGRLQLAAHRLVLVGALPALEDLLCRVWPPGARALDHPVFCSVETRSAGPTSSDHQTIVTLNDTVSAAVFQQVLLFAYTWNLDDQTTNSRETLDEVKLTAMALNFSLLVNYVDNILNGNDYINRSLSKAACKAHQDRLKHLIMKRCICTDVVFEVDGSTVSGHKGLLMVRSDMMACMFSNNFLESSAEVVRFPGLRKIIFVHLLEYLYTDRLVKVPVTELVELIELANRLCLPRVQALAEEMIIHQLNTMIASGQEIFEEVAGILEPAQLHNADQLAAWCLWYLSCNYVQLYKKHSKLKQGLSPDNQILLSQNRWPPVWYLKERDFYEKCLLDYERSQKVPHAYLFRPGSNDNNDGGCLCFCSRRNRDVQYPARSKGAVLCVSTSKA